MKKLNTNHKSIRIIVASALAILVTVQVYPIATSRAIFGIGDVTYVVGGPVTVSDPVHTGATTAGLVAEASKFVLDQALKVALQALKKRLLDTMTDQIVGWINGNGAPKFTTNFGSVFRDAADAAVGDVLQQYAETKVLCEPFAFNIQLQLQQPPPLSRQVTCSLTQVIGNFQAYRNNFQNGGWLGYQELLKPQNNQWGVEIITQNEILNRTAQKTNASVLKQQVNIGFNSEECTGGWDLIDKRTNLPATKYPVTHFNPDKSRSPDDPPLQFLPPGDSNVALKCTSATVTTPGSALAAGLPKALYSGLDFIINAQDLSNSLAIIADAAFNRLIRVGAKGLTAATSELFSETTTGQAPPPASVSTSTTQAIDDYQNTQNQIVNSTRNTYLSQLNPAKNTALSASSTLDTASSTNQAVISTADELLTCLATGVANPTDTAFAQNAINTASSTNRQIITNKSNEVELAIATLDNLILNIGSPSCDLACLSQINQQNINNAISTATGLNIDANNILLGVQNTLTSVQIKLATCKNGG